MNFKSLMVLLMPFCRWVFAVGPELCNEINALIQNNTRWAFLTDTSRLAIFDQIKCVELPYDKLLQADPQGNYVDSHNIRDKIRQLYVFVSCHSSTYLMDFIGRIKITVLNCYLVENQDYMNECLTYLGKFFSLYHDVFAAMKKAQTFFTDKSHDDYPDDLSTTIDVLERISDFTDLNDCSSNVFKAETSVCKFVTSNCRPVHNDVSNNNIAVSSLLRAEFDNAWEANTSFKSALDMIESHLIAHRKSLINDYEMMGLIDENIDDFTIIV